MLLSTSQPITGKKVEQSDFISHLVNKRKGAKKDNGEAFANGGRAEWAVAGEAE